MSVSVANTQAEESAPGGEQGWGAHSENENRPERWPLPGLSPVPTHPLNTGPNPSMPGSVLQGRHVKTGQLAAIKVMDVTEVGAVTGRGKIEALSGGWGLGAILEAHHPPPTFA